MQRAFRAGTLTAWLEGRVYMVRPRVGLGAELEGGDVRIEVEKQPNNLGSLRVLTQYWGLTSTDRPRLLSVE